MAAKKLKCSKCKRTFAMAAHLGRHMTAMHGMPGARTSAATKAGKGKGSASTTRVVVQRSLSTAKVATGVKGFVRGMQAYRTQLAAQRNDLDQQIGAIEEAISAMSGAPVKRAPSAAGAKKGRKTATPAKVKTGSGRSLRPGSLKATVLKVLSGRATPMSPREISDAVGKAGYKSKAKNLTSAVSNVLPEIEQVRRLGFGKYTA